MITAKSLCICFALALAGAALAQNPTIAVMPFRGDATVSPEQLDFITGKFTSEVIATKSFTVLDRGRMDFILKEQGFQQSGVCNSSECQVQMGQLLGVDHLVAGNLVRFGSRYAFRADYIDVGNGQIKHTVEHSETGALEDVFEPLCKASAQKLARAVRGTDETQTAAPIATTPAPAPIVSPPIPIAQAPAATEQMAEPELPKVSEGALDNSSKSPRQGLSGRRKVALALLGLGGVAMGVGVGFDSEMANQNDAFKKAAIAFNTDPNEQTAQAWRNTHEDAIDAKDSRDISWGTGAGLVLVGGILWFWP